MALNAWISRRRRTTGRCDGKALHDTRNEDPMAQADAREDAERALDTLTPKQRAAVVLTLMLGFTSEEAARVLRVRPSTVRALVKRARDKLQEGNGRHHEASKTNLPTDAGTRTGRRASRSVRSSKGELRRHRLTSHRNHYAGDRRGSGRNELPRQLVRERERRVSTRLVVAPDPNNAQVDIDRTDTPTATLSYGDCVSSRRARVRVIGGGRLLGWRRSTPYALITTYLGYVSMFQLDLAALNGVEPKVDHDACRHWHRVGR